MSFEIDKYNNETDIQCFYCLHLINLHRKTCSAFDAIPDKILTGEHNHKNAIGREKKKDGQPILFESIENA